MFCKEAQALNPFRILGDDPFWMVFENIRAIGTLPSAHGCQVVAQTLHFLVVCRIFSVSRSWNRPFRPFGSSGFHPISCGTLKWDHFFRGWTSFPAGRLTIGRNGWFGGVTVGVVVIIIVGVVVAVVVILVVMTDNFVLNPRVNCVIMGRINVGIHWVAVVVGTGVPRVVVVVRVRKGKRLVHGFFPVSMVAFPTGWPLEDLGT